MSTFRALYRLAGFIGCTLVYAIGFAIVREFTRDRLSKGIRWRSSWLRQMLPFTGIETVVTGQQNLTRSPSVYIVNHRSYIDPVVALHLVPGVIIAKAELSKWPLIGAGAAMAGVIFVQRSDRNSRGAAYETMSGLLQKGFSLIVFPEGTTTRAPGLLPFRSGAFRLAATHNVPVVPMAIEFENPDDAWIGDDTFIRHFFQTFRRKKIIGRVSIGPPVINSDSDLLMNNVHDWIRNELDSLGKWVQKGS
jgi:1-acyl-sn-glycerol-3-phosphate acyltransferase